MSLVGTWVPGRSPLHRAPAGAKLLGLAVVELVLALAARTPPAVAVAALATAAAYAVARVPAGTAWRMLRPILVIAVLVGAAQWLYAGPQRAVVVAGQLVVAVALAVLVTVTTRTSALLDAVERGLRPLRLVGVDPARVALTLALAVRSVPVVGELLAELREAQRARGVTGGVTTLGVPLVVRTVRHAESLGEALAARGVDD
jgi:biotin transport system permease protein